MRRSLRARSVALLPRAVVFCVVSGAALLTGAALAAPLENLEHPVGVFPQPRPICVGVLRMADADSGEVVGCGRFRLPDVDACEWHTPRGRRAQAEARQLYNGRTVTMRLDAKPDRYGRHVTSPKLTDTDLATDVVARGLAEPRVWLAIEERWQDEEPECAE